MRFEVVFSNIIVRLRAFGWAYARGMAVFAARLTSRTVSGVSFCSDVHC